MHRVLLIGATGVLGRPVARVLAADERFRVSALVRDTARAAKVLPGSISLVQGDVRDRGALVVALRSCESVYLNLANPFTPRARFDADYHGTRLVLEALHEIGARRVLRISALVAAREADWWLVRRKREIDSALTSSGLPYTLFLPTWFMESLPTFRVGPFLVCPPTPGGGLYWIAGQDYGSQVASALMSPEAIGRTFVIQGPESVAFTDAVRRFIHAQRMRLRTLPAPRPALNLAALGSAKARYLRDLIDATFDRPESFQAAETWRVLGQPRTTIEDYAASIARTGDWPRK